MTGSALQEALEHAVYRYSDAIGRGEFLQMSGIRVVYDLTKETCQRVASVSILCSFCSTPTYSDLDPYQKYGVIITSFLYEGGDGFTMFQVRAMQWILIWSNENHNWLCFHFTEFRIASFECDGYTSCRNLHQKIGNRFSYSWWSDTNAKLALLSLYFYFITFKWWNTFILTLIKSFLFWVYSELESMSDRLSRYQCKETRLLDWSFFLKIQDLMFQNKWQYDIIKCVTITVTPFTYFFDVCRNNTVYLSRLLC